LWGDSIAHPLAHSCVARKQLTLEAYVITTRRGREAKANSSKAPQTLWVSGRRIPHPFHFFRRHAASSADECVRAAGPLAPIPRTGIAYLRSIAVLRGAPDEGALADIDFILAPTNIFCYCPDI
jgi:hypothetical protein